MSKIDTQYRDAGQRLLKEGVWFDVQRNGSRRLTIPNVVFNIDLSTEYVPLNTTRQSPIKLGIGELLCYIRGETDSKVLEDFMAPSWNANANENESWLNNPYRKGENDMGHVYGDIGNNWPRLGYPKDGSRDDMFVSGSIDLLDKIYNNLKNGIDNGDEIWTFWNPGMFHMGCLRPCLHSHHFTLLDGTIYLNSTQRSSDAPLGVVSNIPQVYVLGRLMAQITGNKGGSALHTHSNYHVYENQLELFKGEMEREPRPMPRLKINPEIKTLKDLRTWVHPREDFELLDYNPHPKIIYPFQV